MTTELRLADDRQSVPGVLERALWQSFAAARDAEDFAQSWLALQCAQVAGATAGAVIMGPAGSGPFSPLAIWPADKPPSLDLTAAVDAAMRNRQPAVVGAPAGEIARAVAQPILIDGELHGAVALAIAPKGAAAAEALRQLHWGAGWIEALVRRQDVAEATHLAERATLGFDLLAGVVEHAEYDAAALGLVTELARRFDCDPVALGQRRRRGCKVRALSHASDFGRKLTLARRIAEAMDEAADQRAVIAFPPAPDWEYRVTLAHDELARELAGAALLTVPIQADGEVVGALLLARPGRRVFDGETVELIDAAASLLGPVLVEKAANDRWLATKIAETVGNQLRRLLGPRYFGRKLATLIAAGVVAFFATATTDYAVTAPATVEAGQQRVLAAPFAGYVAAQYARAGELIAEGALLASLDDQDMRLEHMRWTTARSQRQIEYDRAVSARDRAESAIIAAQVEQAEAQLALIEEQLTRTRIAAPFDAVVVEGDLSQRVGGTVERGETLFVLAPLSDWRVVLEVDETDIGDIAPGQTGQLLLGAMPEAGFSYVIEAITPIARQSDGSNHFRVEATLQSDDARLRPSMTGIAKTAIDERLLILAWTHHLRNWAQMTAWRWAG
jgi:multidrug resistance efflux pump